MFPHLRPVFTLATGFLMLCQEAGQARPVQAFFAMDTIAKGGPETVVPLLKRLGYAGLGGQPGDVAMAAALESAGLRLFNGYQVVELSEGQPVLTDDFRGKVEAMRGGKCGVLWLAVSRVSHAGGVLAAGDARAEAVVVAQLKELATFAAEQKVRISLYPHTGFYLSRVEEAMHLAAAVDRPNLGVTFNLCHWLKVEGAARDPEPVLRAALSRLDFVTVNGADTGDTKTMGWDRLIQPLGHGTFDLSGFVRMLGRVGYRGPVGFQGFGIKGEPALVLEESMRVWEQMGGVEGGVK